MILINNDFKIDLIKFQGPLQQLFLKENNRQ